MTYTIAEIKQMILDRLSEDSTGMNTNQLRHKLPKSQEWNRLKEFLASLTKDGLITENEYSYAKGPIYKITQLGMDTLERLRRLAEDPTMRHFLPRKI